VPCRFLHGIDCGTESFALIRRDQLDERARISQHLAQASNPSRTEARSNYTRTRRIPGGLSAQAQGASGHRSYLFAYELIPANPMPQIGRPNVGKTLRKPLPTGSVERGRAIIPTAVLAGPALRRAVPRQRWRCSPDRLAMAPSSSICAARMERPSDSGEGAARSATSTRGCALRGRCQAPLHLETHRQAPTAPLFVGADGDRIIRGTMQYRVLRAFRRGGFDSEGPKVRSCTGCDTPGARGAAGSALG